MPQKIVNITGSFNVIILTLGTDTEVEDDISLGVMDDLETGEYLIFMESRTICSIQDYSTPLYSFKLSCIDADYEFESIEDEDDDEGEG